jgi:hypothetical protein
MRKAPQHRRHAHSTNGSVRVRRNARPRMPWLDARARESGRSAPAGPKNYRRSSCCRAPPSGCPGHRAQAGLLLHERPWQVPARLACPHERFDLKARPWRDRLRCCCRWYGGGVCRSRAGNQRLNCIAMIAAGRIDNSISSVGFGLQKRRVVERPDDRLDIVGRNRAGLRLVTNQAANLMTRCDKGCCNCAADEAVRAGDEDLHFCSSAMVSSAINRTRSRRAPPSRTPAGESPRLSRRICRCG